MNIAGIEIGAGQPCRFVAEQSNAHGGDLARAHRMIDATKATGAELIKWQCYTPSELVELRGDGPAPEPWGAQGWTMRTLYEKARTPLEWFPELFQHARDIGLVPFSSVFGLESLALLESIGNPAYKIARLDSLTPFVATVRATGKPLLISTDYTDEEFQELRGYRDHWLFCPAGYPAENVVLPCFAGLDDEDGDISFSFLGLSSHCLDPLLPVAAVARGCKLIEMHFMLDDEPSELEASVSLTASQFREMIANVRKVEEMLA